MIDGSPRRGVPIYQSPDVVLYRVSTLHGIVDLFLWFPGLYEDSVANDFSSVKQVVEAEVEAFFAPLRSYTILFGYTDPICVRDYRQVTCCINASRPIHPVMVPGLEQMLNEIYGMTLKLVIGRMMSRLSELSDFDHPFESLWAMWEKERSPTVTNESSGISVTVDSTNILFQQNSPMVLMSIHGWPKEVIKINFDQLVDYLDWRLLQDLVITSRNCDFPVGALPATKRARFDKGRIRLRIHVGEDGSIAIRCKFEDGSASLLVASRDPKHAATQMARADACIRWEDSRGMRRGPRFFNLQMIHLSCV